MNELQNRVDDMFAVLPIEQKVIECRVRLIRHRISAVSLARFMGKTKSQVSTALSLNGMNKSLDEINRAITRMINAESSENA